VRRNRASGSGPGPGLGGLVRRLRPIGESPSQGREPASATCRVAIDRLGDEISVPVVVDVLFTSERNDASHRAARVSWPCKRDGRIILVRP